VELFLSSLYYTVHAYSIANTREVKQVSDLEEMVTLERINLIARLSSGCECQKNDKDIALIWIAELSGISIAEILRAANVANK
jgi:hypothetical protein